MASFWNHADKHYAHIDYGGYLHGEKAIQKEWRKSWLHKWPLLHSVTVAEYGVGGGLLGQLLLESYNVSHYIGIDISSRQLRAVSSRLNNGSFAYSLLLARKLTREMLKPFRIDVFISQAVIQHFPDNEYLLDFLSVLSHSKIEHIMLQVRQTHWAKEGSSVSSSLFTSCETLLKGLPNYKIRWNSSTPRANGYVFYWFLRT